MADSTIIFWLGVLIYFAAVIYLGLRPWWKRKERTTREQGLDYWIAQRQLPGWWLAISLTAGWLMLGWIGFGMSQVYGYGTTGLWILPLPWLILCFIIIYIARHVRRVAAISIPEAIEKRFGVSARTFVAFCSIFVFTSWAGAEMWMAGNLASPFLKISPSLAMVIIGMPIMVYAFTGGFKAVVRTDLLQFAIMATFITVLGIVTWNVASDVTAAQGMSIGEAISQIEPPYLVGSGPGSYWSLMAIGWITIIVLLVAFLPGWTIEQDLWLRLQAAKSTRESVKGAVIALFLIGIFILVIPSVIASCALIIYPPGADGSINEAIVDDAGYATQIISRLILDYFPVWAAVLMLVGLVAAQMSTVDTFANVVALPLTFDLVQPHILEKRKMAKEDILKYSRYLSVVAVLMALLYALLMNVYYFFTDVYIISSGVLTASIAIPVAAMYLKRTNLAGALLASFLGFIGTTGGYYIEYYVFQNVYSPIWLANTYYGYIIVGVAGSLIGLTIGTLLGAKPTKAQVDAIRPTPVEGTDDFKVFHY